MRGFACAAIAAAALFVASPGTAALVVRDDVDSADVTFVAGAGEANRLFVREEPGGFRFVDSAAVLTTTTCTQVNTHEVFCPGIAETLIVELGDGDDVADVAWSLALVVGGPGDDEIVAANAAGGEGDDVLRGIGAPGRLRGGPGDDTVLGGSGNDVLAIDSGNDRLDGGRGNDAYVLDAGARGVAATIADSGGDRRDSISVTCKGARLLSASRGSRDRRGRYALPHGTVTFAGLDGALPCALPKVVGLTLARARRALVAAGFRLGTVTYRRSAAPRGRIVSQRRAGSTVSVVVSSGPGGSG